MSDTARRGWRAGVAGLALISVAGLFAAAPAGAQAPPREAVFVHSAASGELGGGRLTLHGVNRRVTWAHNSGRFGVMAVKRMHRRVFAPMRPAATGTLHVEGHHGGDELILRLTRPRYSAARRTVSYRVRRVGRGRLPGRGARAAGIARGFGAASLTIQDPPQPTVNVDLNVYNCTSGADGTCWGTVSASGLTPNACCLVVSGPMVGGNTGQGVETDFRVDANGNVGSSLLNYLCQNEFGIYISSITVDATEVGGQSNDYNAPGCG
jgi:hypothetical protein